MLFRLRAGFERVGSPRLDGRLSTPTKACPTIDCMGGQGIAALLLRRRSSRWRVVAMASPRVTARRIRRAAMVAARSSSRVAVCARQRWCQRRAFITVSCVDADSEPCFRPVATTRSLPPVDGPASSPTPVKLRRTPRPRDRRSQHPRSILAKVEAATPALRRRQPSARFSRPRAR